jgi:methionyl-tRNA formyltransferase
MRILCCLNRDLASSLALNLLLPTLKRHEVRVGLTEQVGDSLSLQNETPERRELRIAEQWLPNNILFPMVDRCELPDCGSRYLSFAEIERYRGIPVESMPNANAPTELARIRTFAPDLILSIRYGAILKAPVIAIPRLGVLNLHSGVLPSYRGVLATFRALLNEDAEIGCTLHYISDPTIDTGDIIGVRTIAVDRDRSLLGHILALYPPGAALVSAVIEEIANGSRPRAAAQSSNDSAYYSYPSGPEWAQFLRRGWRIAEMRDVHDAFRRYTDRQLQGEA